MPVKQHKAGTRRWMTETKRENRTRSLLSSNSSYRPMEQLHRRSGWSRWAGLLLLSTLCAVAAARRIPGPPITLPVRWVLLEQTPEQMKVQMRYGLSSRLLIQDANAAVAQFESRAGIFRYETVELIRFFDQGVTFEHLRGPFQSCVERFEFVPLADGGYTIEHQGTFVMRGGLLGWLLGILVIRGVFDRLVATHMQNFSGATDS